MHPQNIDETIYRLRREIIDLATRTKVHLNHTIVPQFRQIVIPGGTVRMPDGTSRIVPPIMDPSIVLGKLDDPKAREVYCLYLFAKDAADSFGIKRLFLKAAGFSKSEFSALRRQFAELERAAAKLAEEVLSQVEPLKSRPRQPHESVIIGNDWSVFIDVFVLFKISVAA